MRSGFRRLAAYEAAARLSDDLYRVVAGWRSLEQWSLGVQLLRAVDSVGANIAEGCGRSSDADTRRCLHIALGSACETLNHALLARDLGLLDDERFALVESHLAPVRRMLVRLIERISAPRRRQP